MGVFYHYTSTTHLPFILKAGFLKVVESNISLTRDHAGPDVVWLTDEDDLQQHHAGWADGTPVDKLGVRFTLELPDDEVIPWRSFARHHRAKLDWIEALNASGGGSVDHWYVIARPVPRSEWRQVAVKRAEADKAGIPQGVTSV